MSEVPLKVPDGLVTCCIARLQVKRTTPTEQLCRGLPRCFQALIDYAKTLDFEQVSSTLELTRGNRQGQFHEFTGQLTSKVNSSYHSRSQWP